MKCTGVSIIWCAILAWLIMIMMLTKRRRRYYIDKNNDNNALVATKKGQSTAESLHLIHKQTPHASRAFVSLLSKQQPHAYAKFVIGINILVLLYYAIIAEPITTVAHVCAIILGLVLWRIACLVRRVRSAPPFHQ